MHTVTILSLDVFTRFPGELLSLLEDIIVCFISYKIEAAKALLEAGANPNLKDKLGRTALIIAASKGRTNAIELLLKYPSVDRDIQVYMHVSTIIVCL